MMEPESEMRPLLHRTQQTMSRYDRLRSASRWRWGVASILCTCLGVSSVFLGFASYKNVQHKVLPDSQLMANNLEMINQAGFSLFGHSNVQPSPQNVQRFLNATDQPNMFPWLTLGAVGKAIEHGRTVYKRRRETEKALFEKGIIQDRNTAMGIHSLFQSITSSDAKRLVKFGIIKEGASKYLKDTLNLTTAEVQTVLPLLHLTGFNLFASGEESDDRARCWKNKPFRTADGSCNNIRNPKWGSTLWPYRRLIRPHYADGVSTPRVAISGKPLPNARNVTVSFYEGQPAKESPVSSAVTILFGLFIDHDVTDTAGVPPAKSGSPFSCCHPDLVVNPDLKHPECYEIQVGPDDPFYSQYNVTCIEFTRSAHGNFNNLGPRQQMNHITSYLDGSGVYGSTDDTQHSLRVHKKGRLINSTVHLEQMMIQQKNTTCGNVSAGIYCFTSGDFRSNLQFPLTAMHGAWFREHQRIVDKLSLLNPDWDDERLYQESRRLLVAELQHITYNEYLPLILGGPQMIKSDIVLQKSGYFNGYIDTLDATVSNIFGVAAFRFGHNQVMDAYNVIDDESRVNDTMLVRNAFLNPETLYKSGSCPVFKGMLQTHALDVGRHFSRELRDYTFKGTQREFGSDLNSMTIQRGRDHGSAGYSTWRSYCGLSPVQTWNDFVQFAKPEDVYKLQRIYEDVRDIDLMVGAVLEPKAPGALVGPTLTCLIAEQFRRLRLGDRYWYESGAQPYPFTPEQLQEIRKASIARILCDNNAALESVQPQAFKVVTEGNTPASCEDTTAIPKLNLNLWKSSSNDDIFHSDSGDNDNDNDVDDDKESEDQKP